MDQGCLGRWAEGAHLPYLYIANIYIQPTLRVHRATTGSNIQKWH